MAQDFLQKAQQLMLSEDFQNAVNRSASRFSKGGAANMGFGDSDVSALEAQVFGYGGGSTSYTQPTQMNEQREIDFNSRGAQKLPQAIRESMMNNPTPQFSMDDVNPLAKMANQLKLTEQQQQPQQMPRNFNGNVDYTALKSIINECLQENLTAIRKSLLNESVGNTFRGMKFVDGNKIQFIDSKGNLYEGELKFKKKINKK